ncbi:hypothetical protein ABB37_04087 [Leptomonas pyrrhocoris]|uniref:Uncharacterized protein n=1 Tax=Leptomonas pyrrhocoris TaxID=157538 RepID=A0A0N0DWN2_LEPPY|nr:hypothetical protein ABB37_04087 [Leptomonas pyrrhocoris]XP_015660262.1 hypothetical protein ABB37_04087 [Leptomonas pyrrhocoris]KPA81822.1 hypothetical protein ABB37_04087 [Leptomonas pyrrhocoris]KPA81823.1 hypothetical protein ABB37_04087 [Leptomonas pyrrhocoris]|eukprot:XP_015660261.1 hypothetical protein ABB37_04087 [Leptomonas pyrrhocoris]
MFELLLRGYLVYLSFVQPVVYGAQLCHSPNPDPQQVTNVTLTLIFSWLLEVADVVFLSSFIAMRWLYVCARIVLALYLAHPRFLGSVQIYRKLFATLVDNYSPVVDSIVVRHVQTIGESGLMQYGALLSAGLMRGVAALGGIAKTLLEASAATSVPAASLPRRMSQARDDTALETAYGEHVEAVPPPLPPARQSPPPARSRAIQPPSLFEDEGETSPSSSSDVEYTFEEVRARNARSWSEADDNSEPVLGLGVTNRLYREPETVVNRARYKTNRTNPFDD